MIDMTSVFKKCLVKMASEIFITNFFLIVPIAAEEKRNFFRHILYTSWILPLAETVTETNKRSKHKQSLNIHVR